MPILKKRNHKISIYQVFIEPKGDQFKDSTGGFDNSKEGWKQIFLQGLENESEVNLEMENKQFKLVGLPFYNEQLKKEFGEVFEEKLLS